MSSSNPFIKRFHASARCGPPGRCQSSSGHVNRLEAKSKSYPMEWYNSHPNSVSREFEVELETWSNLSDFPTTQFWVTPNVSSAAQSSDVLSRDAAAAASLQAEVGGDFCWFLLCHFPSPFQSTVGRLLANLFVKKLTKWRILTIKAIPKIRIMVSA